MGALLLATIACLAVQGFWPPGPVQQVVVTALAASALLLAFRAAEVPPRLFQAAVVISLVALVLSLLHAFDDDFPEGVTRLMNALLVALAPPAIAVGEVRELRRVGEVRIETVAGALSFYILIGMFFAFTYGAMDHFGSGDFFTDGDTATVSHCIYFSFTTLTTVGYGDFVARTDAGHTLAVFEALLGQIYLVTIVSLIVGNLRRPASRA
jgi:hypothetical protein